MNSAAFWMLPALFLALPVRDAAGKDKPVVDTPPLLWDARLVAVEGKVWVHIEGSGEEEGLAGEKHMALAKGDRVETDSDGRAEIAFKDDSIAELGPDSSLTVLGLEKTKTIFGLNFGRMAAKIKLMYKRQFQVRTKTGVAAIRGTEFAVEIVDDAEDPPKLVVGVFKDEEEGDAKVWVTAGEDEGKDVRVIREGEEAEMLAGEPPGEAVEMDFLLRRAGSIAHLRDRQKSLREEFKKYTLKNRQEQRKRMLRMRDEIRGRGSKMEEDIRRRRKEMEDRIRGR